MELKTIRSKTETELKTPEQALRAWTNGCRTPDELSLSDPEKEAKHQENNDLLQEILIERLFSHSWSARAFFNVIEELYPKLSQDEVQIEVRRTLMGILRSSMEVVETKRLREDRYKGVLQI